MRGEVRQETPKKKYGFRRIFLMLHMTLSSAYLIAAKNRVLLILNFKKYKNSGEKIRKC